MGRKRGGTFESVRSFNMNGRKGGREERREQDSNLLKLVSYFLPRR